MRATLVLLTAVALAGCGRIPPGEDVRVALRGFAEATAKRDYQALCDRWFAPSLVGQVERAGLPCEVAVKPGIDAARDPRLVVQSVTIKGDRARARVRTSAANQPPSTDTIALVRVDGRWRIASLG